MAQRGGRRPRQPAPGVPVSCRGRWGRRRARVEQCAVTIRAEVVYDRLIRDGVSFGPGWAASFTWVPSGAAGHWWHVAAEVVPNAVWRRGRLFLRCQHCRRRATRLYVPVVDVEPRCRRCWGLNYQCQSWSYKPSGGAPGTLGPVAYLTTAEKRDERLAASWARYAARRETVDERDSTRQWNRRHRIGNDFDLGLVLASSSVGTTYPRSRTV